MPEEALPIAKAAANLQRQLAEFHNETRQEQSSYLLKAIQDLIRAEIQQVLQQFKQELHR